MPSLFSKYLYFSFHVAFALLALVKLFALKHIATINSQTPINQEENALFYSIFLSCILGYNFTKGILRKKNKSLLNKILHLSCVMVLLLGLLQLPLRTLLVFAINLAGTLGYIIPSSNGKNWRERGILKSFIVAICWANAVILTFWVHYNLYFDQLFIYQYLSVFLLVVALIIPFDIRDLDHDPEDLQTIPKLLGVRKSKIVCILLLVGFCFCALQVPYNYLLLGKGYPCGIWTIFIVANFMVILMPKKIPKYYCSFWIEAIPILGYLIALMIKNYP